MLGVFDRQNLHLLSSIYIRSSIFIRLVVFTLCCLSFSVPVPASEKRMISIKQIEIMFEKMRADGKFNVDSPLLWRYFFAGKSKESLTALKTYLVERGFRFVDIYPSSDKRGFWLHIERIEVHTPQTLDELNLWFYGLVDQFQIDTYDGMDVGRE
jgi:Regulator of ribonuclease activity B